MYDMSPVVDPVRFGSSGIHHSSTARNKISLGNHVPGPWPRSPYRCARQPGRAPTRYHGPRQCTPARAPLPPMFSPFVVLRLEPAGRVHAYAAAEECRERHRGRECTWRPDRHRRSVEGEQRVREGNGALRRLDSWAPPSTVSWSTDGHHSQCIAKSQHSESTLGESRRCREQIACPVLQHTSCPV